MSDDTNENYYHVLNISEDATLDEIKKAYRRLAVQFHPDKNSSPEAEEKFKMLSRAYNVLSNPDQRSRYDSDRNGGPSTGFGGYTWSGFSEDPRKTFRNLFSDYFNFDGDFANDDDFMRATHERFSKSSRFSEANNMRTHERSQERNSSQNCEVNHGGFSSTFNHPKKRKPTTQFGGFDGTRGCDTPSSSKRTRTEPNSTNTNQQLPKDSPIERPLEISLEELATGCTKKLKIKRTINSNTGRSTIDSKLIEIPVKPGWKAGTRITYPEVGDSNPGSIPADITFIVADKPHALFTRDSNNNLLHTAKISLKNALLGVSYCIQGLNGKRHNVNVKDIIHPGFVKRYPGEGLPLPKAPSTRGDLIVTFDIEFPRYLSWDQRRMISECLPE